MGRWEPDAAGRMVRAALELYAERGFEQTTVQDIAARAGVTERTFFRYFADKREVLFDSSHQLEHRAATAATEAPADAAPLDVAGRAMVTASAMLDGRREHARARAAVVTATPSLQERELLKMAGLADTLAAALRERDVTEPTATLAAQSAVTAFRVGFAAWIGDDAPGTLGDRVADALAGLRTLAAG